MAKPSPYDGELGSNFLRLKTVIGGVLAAALGIGGLVLAMPDGSPKQAEQTAEVKPESRNPDQIQAPPRPPLTRPIERVVTQAPK